ncbi:NUDIX domain-containing protein [Embleya sp. AB8]|uniref:NUDIX domain-containing protein n=1 Tax=Embleya sp. AB8 TaxID=3156304 RepID=UPI003C733FE6
MPTCHTRAAVGLRVAAVVFAGHDIRLVHRRRAKGDRYSVQGGNVDPHEDLDRALARELEEELALDLDDAVEPPEPCRIQDRLPTRPTAHVRKLHPIHRVGIPTRLRARLATVDAVDTERPHPMWIVPPRLL